MSFNLSQKGEGCYYHVGSDPLKGAQLLLILLYTPTWHPKEMRLHEQEKKGVNALVGFETHPRS